MNLAPVRGSYLDRCCGASPAHDMRPLQGQQRELMSCGGDRGKPLSWNMSPFQGRWRLLTNLDFYGILNTLRLPPIFSLSPQNKSAGAFSGAFVIIAFVIIYKSEHIIYT